MNGEMETFICIQKLNDTKIHIIRVQAKFRKYSADFRGKSAKFRIPRKSKKPFGKNPTYNTYKL